MTSRVETEIIYLKGTLEKALVSEISEETITDAITALKKIPISIDLLRKTKIGQTLQDLKKKYASTEVGAVTKALLSKWKKDCEAGPSSDDADKKSAAAQPIKIDTQPIDKAENSSKDTTKSPRNSHEEDELIDESHYEKLSSIRRKVRDRSFNSIL